ncbi:thioesterase family protein [Bacillus sp. B15-48]|uniref:acyl-CoA thioesterase n=1 Tax=Bacillus sp. B15-48 TaxID=1548601 RepID=UPI00193F6EB8|nr:thioesterase family protein [Bacillus sp. B15-48]MBM4764982.1 acyl-CoA thioesterase [Bacillus sp. B15-48]
MKIHEYSKRVEWGDTDAAGIVFSPNFYRWLDEAVHYFFESVGYPLTKVIKEEQITIPVVESKCSFQRPLKFADHFTIQTTILEIRDKVIKFNHDFIKDGEKIASAYQIRAIVDITGEKLKAVSIPPHIRRAINGSRVVVE